MSGRYALLVGVSEYGTGYEPLPGTVNDVERLKQVLENPDMGGFNTVEQLLNPDPQPLREKIEAFFSGRDRDDVLLFYFSGHGALDNSTGSRLHLSTQKTYKNGKQFVQSSGVEAAFLHTHLIGSKSHQKIVILDCCFSGAMANLLKKGEGSVNLQPLKAQGTVVLASCSAFDVSFQTKGGGTADIAQSLYTRYLVEGIETGAARQKRNNWIFTQDLHNYAQQRFQTELAAAVEPQIIVFEKEGYQIPIARAPRNDPKADFRQTVAELLKENDGELDELDHFGLRIERQNLGLSDEDAQKIVAEQEKPYLVRFEKLKQYRKAFQLACRQGYPLSDRVHRKLQRIQNSLSLREQDVESIEAELAPQADLTPQSQTSSSSIANQEKVQPQPKSTYPTFSFEVVTVDRQGQIVERRQAKAEYHSEELGNGVTLELVKVPAGKFLMGSPKDEIDRLDDEAPQHWVTVPEFWMGKFPVTQAQYQAVIGSNPSYFSTDGANRPVEQVSWDDAVAFCQKLSQQTKRDYRLPSEAEWEYACRAKTTTPFYFGPTITTDLANYRGTDWKEHGWSGFYGDGPKGKYRKETTTVGSFTPNKFGLYDMHGNVWEWCQDVWHDSYEGALTDGSAWMSGGGESEKRVRRGGSWFFNPRHCRSAYRYRYARDYQYNDVGFRVVCVFASGS